MGRSRGGLTTKIHALVDAEGRPVRLALTAGQAGDAPAAEEAPAEEPEAEEPVAEEPGFAVATVDSVKGPTLSAGTTVARPVNFNEPSGQNASGQVCTGKVRP